MIGDRLINGALAGICGAIVQNIYALVAKLFGLQGPVYVDYGKIILLYGDQRGPLANGLGFIGHFVWDVIVGIGFAYLIFLTSSRYSLAKGVTYGVIIWFFIKLAATLFRLPVIFNVSPTTVLFFLIGAVLYGIVIAYSLQRLEAPIPT